MLKLSAQLDDVGNPNLPFELYKSYINHNKWRIPQSALDIIACTDWSGGSDSKAPYYSHLTDMQISDLGSPESTLKLLLQKDMYVDSPFQLEITYKGLFALDIPKHEIFPEQSLIWRYEQFLYFDAYHSAGIKNKLFTHQIEWVTGQVWSITAREIEVLWH